MLKGKEPTEMIPWFRGFKGTITKKDDKYITRGTYNFVTAGTIVITELPVGVWTQKFCETLEDLVIDKSVKDAKKKKKQCIQEYWNNSGDANINFKLKVSVAQYKEWKANPEKMEKILGLASSNRTMMSNMCLFNEKHQITKYENTNQIMKAFFELRLEYYLKRRIYLLAKYKRDLDVYKEKIRFIELFIDGELKLVDESDEVVLESLEEHQFIKFYSKDLQQSNDEVEENEEEVVTLKKALQGYDYLIGMSIRTLTKKRMDELKKQRDVRQAMYDELEGKTHQDIWLEDLEKFKIEYVKHMKEWKEMMVDDEVGGKKIKVVGKKTKKI